tara:strand:+ start:1680 stop:3497 length:1818 start_codon:yes stop_codon:yes gene_type:complete
MDRILRDIKKIRTGPSYKRKGGDTDPFLIFIVIIFIIIVISAVYIVTRDDDNNNGGGLGFGDDFSKRIPSISNVNSYKVLNPNPFGISPVDEIDRDLEKISQNIDIFIEWDNELTNSNLNEIIFKHYVDGKLKSKDNISEKTEIDKIFYGSERVKYKINNVDKRDNTLFSLIGKNKIKIIGYYRTSDNEKTEIPLYDGGLGIYITLEDLRDTVMHDKKQCLAPRWMIDLKGEDDTEVNEHNIGCRRDYGAWYGDSYQKDGKTWINKEWDCESTTGYARFVKPDGTVKKRTECSHMVDGTCKGSFKKNCEWRYKNYKINSYENEYADATDPGSEYENVDWKHNFNDYDNGGTCNNKVKVKFKFGSGDSNQQTMYIGKGTVGSDGNRSWDSIIKKTDGSDYNTIDDAVELNLEISDNKYVPVPGTDNMIEYSKVIMLYFEEDGQNYYLKINGTNTGFEFSPVKSRIEKYRFSESQNGTGEQTHWPWDPSDNCQKTADGYYCCDWNKGCNAEYECLFGEQNDTRCANMNATLEGCFKDAKEKYKKNGNMGEFDDCKPTNACTSGLSWMVILDKCVTPTVKSVLTVFPSCDVNETPIIFPYPSAGPRGS